MSVVTGTIASIKQQNRAALLQMLLHEKQITKADLATKTQLSFPTVSNLLQEMQDEGLIHEVGIAASSGGRKPVLYGIRQNCTFFAGVDVQVDRLLVVITDFTGNILAREILSYESIATPKQAVDDMYAAVSRLFAQAGKDMAKLQAIGISMPGPLDPDRGLLIHAPNMPGWRFVPIQDMVEATFCVPCVIERDSNAAAIGESRFGAGRHVNHLIYVTVDVGIGAGIVIHDNIYRGALHVAGEVGHMPVSIDGPSCVCGSRGCLETLASGREIFKQVYGLATSVNLERLLGVERQHAWDEIFKLSGRYMGMALASLCNILNPEMIVLGGRIVEESEVYFDAATEEAKVRVLPDFTQRIKIVRAELGALSSPLGAAAEAFERQFSVKW